MPRVRGIVLGYEFALGKLQLCNGFSKTRWYGKPRKKLTSNLILAPGELAVGRRFTKDVAEGERLP